MASSEPSFFDRLFGKSLGQIEIENCARQARREGYEKGFERAMKAAASHARQEGYPNLAGQIERLKIVKRR